MAYHVARTPRGTFLVTGFSQSWSQDAADAFVLELAGNGRELRRKTFGDARANYGFVLRELASGYILGGWSSEHSAEAPLLVRLDADLNVRWQRDIRLQNSARITDVRSTPDGGFVVAGQIGSSNLDAVVLRLDSLGQTVWQTVVGGSNRDRGFYIDVNRAGEIVLQGLTTTPSTDDDMLLALLDAKGNVEWQKALGGTGYQTGHGVRWSAEGDILAFGYGIADPARGNDALLYRVARDGEIRGRASWGAAGDDRLFNFASLPDGGFITVGTTTSFGALGTDGLVTRLDGHGSVVWQGTLGGPGDQSAYGVVVDGLQVFVIGHEEAMAERGARCGFLCHGFERPRACARC